ncbi:MULTISPECIES: DUF2799 domain-containing protein [Psychrobacter]|jgi:hypothetical protein|uniref:DUF2799 domain-containing protein n=1 Tax=Psychrobacter TaxID=497 RepID=UPI00086C4234|nr:MULTISPECIES: DUF2799 domain-containing protein [Psychrobacter]OEH67257.1 MAG: hypothetical protein BAX61_09930 [Psychrobacter sp. B29-1]|tara:strand:- start:637 stop:1176 length:540 start_codon:yes stop_codon:yes gene_type:complete
MNYIIESNSSGAYHARKLTSKVMSKTGISISLLGAVVLTLSGCATTQSLTPQQCQNSNWQEVGYADGSQGRSGAYFGHYTNSCASIGGASPNRIQWEQGRQQGLKNYCTELNAYKLGREGYDWQPVCPLEGIEKLEEAYSQGRYYYIRQRDLDYLRSPYPFGYRHAGFGYGYRPFGYGW